LYSEGILKILEVIRFHRTKRCLFFLWHCALQGRGHSSDSGFLDRLGLEEDLSNLWLSIMTMHVPGKCVDAAAHAEVPSEFPCNTLPPSVIPGFQDWSPQMNKSLSEEAFLRPSLSTWWSAAEHAALRSGSDVEPKAKACTSRSERRHIERIRWDAWNIVMD